MATKIIMYTGSSCSRCKRAKEMLKSCPVEVDIEERNIDKDDDLRQELTLKYASSTLPTFVINSNIYRGFDENIGKIMEELGL
ncbi:glutaredoxin [Bacillus thuringiensis]|uniref:Glutaredoxin n=1 Tax=Bacillus thuringiensis TaxID=1428 RepID=A0A4R4BKB1_BACTU|nr:glutaredoxin family protein [Bacillus thuringiensis]TCW59062.1 glutaredoxin [Bacillus thuringiensis]TCW59698.1 glutaredoxin [Bacillus thuringiensis]